MYRKLLLLNFSYMDVSMYVCICITYNLAITHQQKMLLLLHSFKIYVCILYVSLIISQLRCFYLMILIFVDLFFVVILNLGTRPFINFLHWDVSIETRTSDTRIYVIFLSTYTYNKYIHITDELYEYTHTYTRRNK